MSLTEEIAAALLTAEKAAARQGWLLEAAEVQRAELVQLRAESELMEQTRLLLLQAGAEARKRVQAVLEAIVTRMLQAVFDESYRFVVGVEDDGREARIYFRVARGAIEEEPGDAMGGGVVDIVSLALRVAYHVLYGIGGPMILDEPGRHLDPERAPRLGEILHELANEFGLQVVLVTHNQTLAHTADQAYLVSHDGESSKITAL